MRVFVTGATGFIGARVTAELRAAGHPVVGLTRSPAGAEALRQTGAEAILGDVNDADVVRAAAARSDAVIHTAFDHDFTQIRRHSEADRRVIEALGEALAGSDRPLIVTSGTGLVQRRPGAALVFETDPPAPLETAPRAATEQAAETVLTRGVPVMVMRLPQVHDARRQGRIAQHIRLAREKGHVAYIGEGANRLPAAHVDDVARLYRLALEHGRAGARCHAVAEEGVAMRDIAEVIGAGLNLPVVSIGPEAAADYFGAIAPLAALDLAASGARTAEALGWTPTGPDLLSDLRGLEWVEG